MLSAAIGRQQLLEMKKVFCDICQNHDHFCQILWLPFRIQISGRNKGKSDNSIPHFLIYWFKWVIKALTDSQDVSKKVHYFGQCGKMLSAPFKSDVFKTLKTEQTNSWWVMGVIIHNWFSVVEPRVFDRVYMIWLNIKTGMITLKICGDRPLQRHHAGMLWYPGKPTVSANGRWYG